MRPEALLRLPAPEGARRIALGLVAEARAASRRLGDPDDVEALHDFRVALRRMRSTLRSWRPALGLRVRRRLRRRLRAIAGATGAVRDAEVQLASVRALAAQSGRPGADAVWLAGRAEAVLADGHAAACRDAQRRFRRLEPKLRRALAPGKDGREESFAHVAAVLVREQSDALASALFRVRSRSAERAAHRARIEAKRLRYLLEPMRGCAGADASAAVAALRTLQDLLGEVHDLHLLGPALTETRRQATPPSRRGLDPLEVARRERLGALFDEFSRTWRGRAGARQLVGLGRLADLLAAWPEQGAATRGRRAGLAGTRCSAPAHPWDRARGARPSR